MGPGDLDRAGGVGWQAVAPGGGALALAGCGDQLRREVLHAGRPVGAREVLRLGLGKAPLGGDLVESAGEALGEAPGIAEDDGRPVALDEVDDALLDGWPDRRPGLGAGR